MLFIIKYYTPDLHPEFFYDGGALIHSGPSFLTNLVVQTAKLDAHQHLVEICAQVQTQTNQSDKSFYSYKKMIIDI